MRRKSQRSVERGLRDLLKKLRLAVRGWKKETRAGQRTIGSLLDFLEREKIQLPFTRIASLAKGKEGEELAKLAVFLDAGELIRFLRSQKVKLVLTSQLVDILLRPTGMHEETEGLGYAFFLKHYHEHSLLRDRVRKSMTGFPRLRVKPSYPADGAFMAWIYDPWTDRVYSFSAADPHEYEKTGKASVLTQYTGNENPFSRESRLKNEEEEVLKFWRERVSAKSK